MPKPRATAQVQKGFTVTAWNAKAHDEDRQDRPDCVATLEYVPLVGKGAASDEAGSERDQPQHAQQAALGPLPKPAEPSGQWTSLNERGSSASGAEGASRHAAGRRALNTQAGNGNQPPSLVEDTGIAGSEGGGDEGGDSTEDPDAVMQDDEQDPDFPEGPSGQRTELSNPSSSSGRPTTNAVGDTSFQASAPATFNLSGPCQLALLPNGSVSGHLIDTRSRACYGIAGKVVSDSPVAIDMAGCLWDDDTKVSRLPLCFARLRVVPHAACPPPPLPPRPECGKPYPACVRDTFKGVARMHACMHARAHVLQLCVA